MTDDIEKLIHQLSVGFLARSVGELDVLMKTAARELTRLSTMCEGGYQCECGHWSFHHVRLQAKRNTGPVTYWCSECGCTSLVDRDKVHRVKRGA